MVPLMERIAWELSERVAKTVNVRTILRYVYLHIVNYERIDNDIILDYKVNPRSNKKEIQSVCNSQFFGLH